MRGVSLDDLRRNICASIACRAAIKINMRLDTAKMEWLLRALAQTDCPDELSARPADRDALLHARDSEGVSPDLKQPHRCYNGASMSEHSKFLLADSQIPTAWVNVLPSLQEPLDPPLQPADPCAADAAGPAAALSDGTDRAGVLAQAGDRYSGRGHGHLPAVARHAAVPRAAAGEGARHSGAHLLQVRGHQSGGQPQAQYRGGAGVLQQARGHPAPGHRNRRGTVGQRAFAGVPVVRPGVHGLHGARQLRPEAVPPHDDAHLGRGGFRQPQHRRPTPAARCWRRRPIRRAAWASPSAKRWKTRPRTPTPTTRWAACSITCCCTRP